MAEDPEEELRRADEMIRKADALEAEAKALRREARGIGIKYGGYRPPALVKALNDALDKANQIRPLPKRRD